MGYSLPFPQLVRLSIQSTTKIVIRWFGNVKTATLLKETRPRCKTGLCGLKEEQARVYFNVYAQGEMDQCKVAFLKKQRRITVLDMCFLLNLVWMLAICCKSVQLESWKCRVVRWVCWGDLKWLEFCRGGNYFFSLVNGFSNKLFDVLKAGTKSPVVYGAGEGLPLCVYLSQPNTERVE